MIDFLTDNLYWQTIAFAVSYAVAAPTIRTLRTVLKWSFEAPFRGWHGWEVELFGWVLYRCHNRPEQGRRWKVFRSFRV